MNLTPEGAHVAMLGPHERKQHGIALIKGEQVTKHTTGAVCYDSVAYVRFLMGNGINVKELMAISGPAWRDKFKFLSGKKWDGNASIPAGSAVGFYRLRDKQVFHAAIATGGTNIRAINGHALGLGWSQVDLKKVLGKPDAEGSFDYDGTKIQVWISKI
jgi:hypothetical protein